MCPVSFSFARVITNAFHLNLSLDSTELCVLCSFARANGRLLVKGQGTLIVLNVEPSDAGTYICRATSTEDSVDAVAYLNVRG